MPRPSALPPELSATLGLLRARRAFEPGRILAAKVAALEAYLRASGVSGAVVGVSGGVDSAVTLGILRRVADRPRSPLRRLVAALVPVFSPTGATGQERALARGREVAAAFGAEARVLDLTLGQAALEASVDRGMGIAGGAWASGQLVSYVRTPALYYAAALLAQEGDLAVVCGTTNRDEGSYIGFFGKASDGMVDLQPISDLHKSEVYALAERLGVPASVLAAIPTGDTYDGRPDEAMIGAPYDFVELYTGLRALADPAEAERLRAGWGPAARSAWERWAAAIEAIHRHNAHKYLAGASAIHFDVLERAVPGGWPRAVDRPPPPPRLVGAFELDPSVVRRISEGDAAPRGEAVADFDDSARALVGVLSAEECEALAAAVAGAPWTAVGVDGYRAGFVEGRDPVGSLRASCHDEGLAAALWRRLAPLVPSPRVVDDDTPTDGDGAAVWRAIGASPVLRFIAYPAGGRVIPHRDAAFDYGDGRRRTLMSVVVTLAGDRAGEGTRLLVDPERGVPRRERDFRDEAAPAAGHRLLAAPAVGLGGALVFDHRVLHEGGVWRGEGVRLILRTDVIFERCGPVVAERAGAAAPLWGRLGVRPGARRGEVDAAYRAAVARGEGEALRFAWRLLRDPVYASAYGAIGDEAAMVRAGFFDDGAPLDDDFDDRDRRWLCTPVHRIRERLVALGGANEVHGVRDRSSGEGEVEARGPLPELCVLVTTGAFCPVHRGHVAMMEAARAAVEARGAVVLGGYLSVSHDGYVLPKCRGDAPPASHRLRMCEEAVKGSEWLMVDPWEAIACPRPVNFSDVCERLSAYLAAHVPTARPIRVVYVFGADNAGFALAFAARGRCVCVGRAGEEARVRALAEHPAIRGEARVIFAPAVGEAATLASSAVRAGDDAGLDAPVRSLWRRLRGAPPAGRLHLFLRDEGAWLDAPWLEGRGGRALAAARERFVAGLASALARAFAAARAPDPAVEVALTIVRRDEQAAEVAGLRARGRVLSLDPCIDGDHDLAVSRCFELAADVAREDLVERPGSLGLGEQIARIPDGEVVLVDDDVASGRTIAQVRALLPARVRVGRVVALCAPHERAGPGEAAELCDARDFLPGARDGGLVIALADGRRVRAPYLLPYVRPAARVGVPLGREVAFSAAVWGLAADFFAAVDPPLRIADASSSFRELAERTGFSADGSLEALCRWHQGRLGGADGSASGHARRS